MTAKWDEELGRRMQEEHKALHQLMQVLRSHIVSTPGTNIGTWLEGLRLGFERLYEHVCRTIAIKEQDGYLETILKQRPTLARQVAAIKAENGQLIRLASGVRRDLGEIRPEDRVLVADVCARIERYMSVLEQHEQRENMIVLFAFNQDIGGD